MGSVLAFDAPTRFELRRALGAGGMGVVHLAWDRDRRMEVALKTLQGTDPANLARLKREFRSLAQVAHPNLIALYELFADERSCFFTMEAVSGARFDAWCATVPRLDAPDLLVSTRVELRSHRTDPEVSGVREARRPASDRATREPRQESAPSVRLSRPVAELARLRVATRGLVDGVEALHRAGMVHCDLKPSNVLVEPDGRTVVLDFGLVRERPRSEGDEVQSIEGTPEYVAPEVVQGRAPTAASDWYQVGVMLYQALAGEPPIHESHYVGTLLAKVEREAPLLSSRVDGLPAELVELVRSLLERDPARRAGAAEIRRWLDGTSPAAPVAAPLEPPFVGRSSERAILSSELEKVASGRPRTVVVRGPSGIGKSALIRRFAEEIEEQGRGIVLAGRCYQREQVPFKALDGVVDAMAARLSRMPATELSDIVPLGAGALMQVFPVLGAVELFAASAPASTSRSPGEVLTEAAEAARELLAKWSLRLPILIVIDDLQWSDADSATFIARMIDPQSHSRILTLATARSGDGAPVLDAMRTRGQERLTELELGPLSPEEGVSLARSMLAASGEADALSFATTIAEGAAGVPFFVTELARHAVDAHSAEVRSVDDAIAARAADVPPAARALLELSAIAGVPLSAALLARAAGQDADPLPTVRLLGARSLLKSGSGAIELVEPYHDRIREVVVAGMGEAQRRSLHAALGATLAAEAGADPEPVAHHLARGGDPRRALPFQLRAAERAAHALAFDRAVTLYEQALELCEGRAQRLGVEIDLAEALVLAGRASEAAPLFLACAESVTGEARARLERRAAEEWLKCGSVDEGVAVLRRVLATVKLRYPDSQLEALGRAVVRILRIRRLDGSFTERAEAAIDPARLARVDAARAAGVGLMMIDPLRGYGFLARFLLDAVAAGEPRRVAAGLCLNAVTLCRGGEPGYPQAKRWLDRARTIAETLDDEYLRGLADACEAGASVTTGRWSEGARFGLGAPARLRSTGTPATWERTAAVSLGRTSLYALGRIAELRTHTTKHLRDANDVGDRFAATYAQVHGWVIAAMDDDVPRGRAELDEALSRWSRLGFHAMHFWRLYGELMYDLYEDRPERGQERLAKVRADLKRSRILAMQFYDAFLSATEAGIELRLAEHARRGKSHLERAREIEKKLAKIGRPYTDGLAAVITGRLALLEGREDAARGALDRAITVFDATEMSLHAASVRARRGAMVGGDEGRAQLEAARGKAEAEGIERPETWLRMLAGE